MNGQSHATFKLASAERIRTLLAQADELSRCREIIMDQVARERDFMEQYEREGSYVEPAKPDNENTTDDGFDGAMQQELQRAA